jgi:hypothetical protein
MTPLLRAQIVKYETGQYFGLHHDRGILHDVSSPRALLTVCLLLLRPRRASLSRLSFAVCRPDTALCLNRFCVDEG